MADAAYYRAYRLKRAEELRAYEKARRQQPQRKAQRKASEARRRAKRRAEQTPLAPVLPGVTRIGKSISFWTDELALDLAQEAELARLEGRDPTEAVKAYRRAEFAWRAALLPLLNEDATWESDT